MTTHRPRSVSALLAATALIALLAPAMPARASGVHAVLAPATLSVEPDSSFSLDLDVNPADAAFNGYTAVVAYDPAALTFRPASPISAQQGCLMTGACSGACGTTFHQFAAAADSMEIDNSLLCSGYSLVGPGQIYTLRFRAASLEQTTTVTLRRALFYNGGIAVTPVSTANATITIHRTVDVAPGGPPGALRLAAAPNPARGATSLSIVSPQAGEQVVDVLDLAGRVVRTLERGWQPAGARIARWDGTGADGARVPAGVYLVRVRAGALVAGSRIVLLH